MNVQLKDLTLFASVRLVPRSLTVKGDLMSVLMYALALFCPVMQMSELVHHEVTDQPDTNDQTFVDPS